MPLPNIFEFIGTNVTQAGFKAAQEKLLQYLGGEVPTKEELNNAVSTKVEKSYVDAAFSAYAGGRKGYKTLALAQADQANLSANTVVDVTNDPTASNNGMYQWNGTTLTKSDFDPLTQSKSYVDQKIKAIKQLYSSANDVSGIYINTGTAAVTPATGTALTVFPIEAGKTYAVKSSRISNGGFSIAYRATNSTAVGATLGLATLVSTSDPKIKKFTVPAGSAAKFAFANMIIPGLAFNITGDLVVSESTSDALISEFDQVQRVGGALVVDIDARNKMLIKGDLTYDTELYDVANNVPDYYVVLPNGNVGNVAGLMLNIFPVKAGITYAIKSSGVNNGALAVALRTSRDTSVGATLGLIELVSTTDPTIKKFTVPSNSPAAYALINIKVPSTGLNVENDLSLKMSAPIGSPEEISSILGSGIADLKARESLKTIENQIVSGVSNLSGKTWIAIGDSITEKNFRANKNYHDFVKEQVGGMVVYNYGISGSGFWNRANTIANSISQIPDYVTLFWGANDLIRAPKTLGNRDSQGTDSLGGLMNIAISSLLTKFYDKKFAVFTLLPRSNYNNVTNATAVDESGVSQGYTATQVADLTIEICEKYSVPVLDLYRISNLYPWVADANQKYFTAPTLTTPDGLHPNDAGQELISYKIRDFLESL